VDFAEYQSGKQRKGGRNSLKATAVSELGLKLLNVMWGCTLFA